VLNVTGVPTGSGNGAVDIAAPKPKAVRKGCAMLEDAAPL
jgi:hypothetical protein